MAFPGMGAARSLIRVYSAWPGVGVVRGQVFSVSGLDRGRFFYLVANATLRLRAWGAASFFGPWRRRGSPRSRASWGRKWGTAPLKMAYD